MTDARQVLAPRKPSTFEVELAGYEPQLAAALPGHISIDRFKRTIITAMNQSPDLAKADRRSLFTACVRAAQDGLLPDGREAALVIFNTKNKKTGEWRQLVQYMPMVQGIIKRMRNSGELAAIYAHVIFEQDDFSYQLGDDPKITHTPALIDRGKPIGAYAVAKLTNGEIQREVMSVSEVEKVRAVSRAKDDGPWRDWWEEMARKTVIRRLAKRLPNSSDIDEMLRREDEQYFSGEGQREQARVGLDRPTRSDFRAAPTIDAEPEPKFEVIDIDGEASEYPTAEAALAAYRDAMDAAEKARGEAGLTGIWESNAGLMNDLDRRGHSDTTKALSREYGERRQTAADRDAAAREAAAAAANNVAAAAAPAGLTQTQRDRDQQFWSAERLTIDAADSRGFQAALFQRLREARDSIEVEALADDNSDAIGGLSKATLAEVRAQIETRISELRARVAPL